MPSYSYVASMIGQKKHKICSLKEIYATYKSPTLQIARKYVYSGRCA
jgi:hypothetical protein